MRSLAIILYFFIIGCFVLVNSIVGHISTDYYTDEIEEGYVWQANLLSRLILPELTKSPEKHNVILTYWKQQAGDAIQHLEIIDTPNPLPGSTESSTAAYISEITITEYTDLATVIVPLSHPQFTNKSLRFQFLDAYSDRYLKFDISSEIAIYIFMGLVICVVALIIYRYMNQISQVTQAVASGDYSQKMPSSKLHALQELAGDINTMAETIEEKVNDNIILTGAIHHELRIPITRVRLALDIALDHQDISEIKLLLEDMDVDLEELTQLMEEILTISRLSLTSEKIPSSSVSIKESIEAIVATLDNPLISFNYESNFALAANETLFERAILNIISNAEKYAQQKVTVRVKTDSEFASIEIEDDGPGIPENEYNLVLKPFYRTDKSRNRNTGGFGLGLAIADMVIHHTGGEITISKSSMGGAKISLQWPIDNVKC